MWGIFGKPFKKGYLEHPGSACCTDNMFGIFVPFGRCMCCLLPCPHIKSNHLLLLPLMYHRNLWCANGHALGVQTGCRLLGGLLPAQQKGCVQRVRSNLHAPTRNTRFCPLQRSLLLQVNFGIGKFTPRRLHSMSSWPRALMLIWKKYQACTVAVAALVERDNNGDDSNSEQSVGPCALLRHEHRSISGSVLKNVNTYPPLTLYF